MKNQNMQDNVHEARRIYVVVGILNGFMDISFVSASCHQNALLVASDYYIKQKSPNTGLAGVFSEEEFEKVYKGFKKYQKDFKDK